MTISRRSDCWLSRDEGRSWTRQLEAAPWGARSGMGMVALPSGALVLAGGGSEAPTSGSPTASPTAG